MENIAKIKQNRKKHRLLRTGAPTEDICGIGLVCTIYCFIAGYDFQVELFFPLKFEMFFVALCFVYGSTLDVILKNIQLYRRFFFAQISEWWMRAVRIYQECSHTVHLHGKKLKAKHNNSGTRSDANVFWKQKLKH